MQKKKNNFERNRDIYYYPDWNEKNLEKLLFDKFYPEDKNIEVSIRNLIDTDRFYGTVNTIIQITKTVRTMGVEVPQIIYLGKDDLKSIINSVFEKENKELVELTNDAITSYRCEEYDMG